MQGKGATAVVPTNGEGLGRRGIRPFGPQAQGDTQSLARTSGALDGFQGAAQSPRLCCAEIRRLCSHAPMQCLHRQGTMQVFVPKEGVTVLFCPSGVRTPQRGQPMGRDGKPVKVPHDCCCLRATEHSTERRAAGPMRVASYFVRLKNTHAVLRTACTSHRDPTATHLPPWCRRSLLGRRPSFSCGSWPCSEMWRWRSRPWTGAGDPPGRGPPPAWLSSAVHLVDFITMSCGGRRSRPAAALEVRGSVPLLKAQAAAALRLWW